MRIPLLDSLLRRDLEEEVLKLRRELLALRQGASGPTRAATHEPLLVIARALRDAPGSEPFAQAALEVVLRETGARRGALFVLREGKLSVFAAREASGPVAPGSFPWSEGIASIAAREGRIVATGKAAEDERFRSHASVARHGLESILALPLPRGAGCLYLDAGGSGFAPFEAATLLAIVDLVAVALERLETEEVTRRRAQLEAIGLAAATIAHDLRSPLATAEFSVAVLRGANAGEEQAIVRAKKACLRARELAQGLVGLATGREKPLAASPQSLAAVVDEHVSLVREELAATGVTVERELDQDVRALLDRSSLLRVLDNLTRNAQRAMPEGGRLRLVVRRGDGMAELEVADCGKGIEPERLARAFALATDAPGGLGLVLVRELVEKMSGTIAIASTVGEGTRFTIRLPLCGETPPAPAPPAAAARKRGSALVIALATLALGTALGLTLLALVRVERRAATNHLDGARARLVARAGVERAIAELIESELRDPSGAPDAPWTYGDRGTPLALAKHPSYARLEDAWGPASGALGGTYVPSGDRYALRVLDTSSQLDLAAAPPILAPALDALGAALRLEAERAGRAPCDPVAGRGARVAAHLAALGRAPRRDDLATVLGDHDAARLGDYVTPYAPKDPLATTFRGFDAAGKPILERTPRAPVCVNTAPWPVLVAVFAGVTGRDGVPVDLRGACAIADRLVAWRASREVGRGPLRTWSSVVRFFESELPACGLSPGQREAVLANASPFLAIAELNPDGPALALGSRTRVLRGTTELALATSGRFEITSRGVLLAPGGEVAADALECVVVRVFETVRHRTQTELARGTGERWTAAPSPADGELAARTGWVQLDPLEAATGDSGLLALDVAGSWSRDVGTSAVTSARKKKKGKPPIAPPGLALGLRHRCGPGVEVVSAPASSPSWLEPEGPYHRDGLRLEAGAAPLVLRLPPPRRASARVSLWVKCGESEREGVLLEVSRAGSSGTAVLRLRGWAGVDRLHFTSELLRDGRTTAATADVAGRAHEWHHLEVDWDGVDHVLRVDGVGHPSGPVDASLAAAPGNLIALGGTLAGTPGGADATIDAVVVDGEPAGPDRYWAEQDRLATYRGRFELLGPRVRLGTIAWTAFRPTRWGSVEFRPDEFNVYAVVKDGSATKSDRPRDGAPAQVAGGDGDPDEDDWEGDDEDDFQVAPATPASAATGTGAASAFTRATRGPGVAIGRRAGVLVLSGDGQPVSPEVVPTGTVGRPFALDYEFAFIYDRSSLAARSLEPPPVGVSPVLEEVVLTYTRGPRVEPIEERE